MTMSSSRRLCSLWSEHYGATCPHTPEPSVSLKNLSLRLNGSVHKVGVTKLYCVSALYFLFFSPSYIFSLLIGIFFLLWKKSLYASVWSVWPCCSTQLHREQLAASGHTHTKIQNTHSLQLVHWDALFICISDLRIVAVEMFLAWLTTHCFMRVVVGGTPPLAQGITAQMAFLLSRSTPSQRTRAQQNI